MTESVHTENKISMDGVFMFKLMRKLFFVGLLVVAFLCGSVWSDKMTLSDGLIRMHVVANSDDAQDQEVKLKVRDAITEYLSAAMEKLPDMESAKAFIKDKLQTLQNLANDVLIAAGVTDRAVISLTREAFPTRQYDTFSLPAGVYESLRVTIGEGKGQNWWCVVFPSLCISATSESFEDTAVGAGFSDTLAGTLTGQRPYRVRFFLLDCIGWVENWLSQK